MTPFGHRRIVPDETRSLRGQVLVAALVTLFLTPSSFAQIPTTIFEINADPYSWQGAYVALNGTWLADQDGVRLWISTAEAEETHSWNWATRVFITDGGAMPEDSTAYNYGIVYVYGTVSVVTDSSVANGPQSVGSVAIDYFEVIQPPPPPPPAPDPTLQKSEIPDGRQECTFALLVSGANIVSCWNDIVQKYRYLTETNHVPVDNVIVLYGQNGSRDPTVIPDGRMEGGNMASGGVFKSNELDVLMAFHYIRGRISEHGCCRPMFQFHSTGHGGGYHTSATQNGRTESSGFSGGKLDTSGDESDELLESDLKFRSCYWGGKDLDRDGRNEMLLVPFVDPGPPVFVIVSVFWDADGDGSFETLIGTDTNRDHHIDKDDANWVAPDLNGSGADDRIGFDEVIELGKRQALSDDDLAGLLEWLVEGSEVEQCEVRVELAQCFSGGFLRDLLGFDRITTAACEEGEVSLARGGDHGFNYYEKPFIETLVTGADWRNAHDEAARQVAAGRHDEHPVRAEMGAVCCLGDVCLVLTELDCELVGGTWWPHWLSACEPNPCTGGSRVCCWGTECFLLTEEECILMGGDFLPEWIACDPNPCTPSPVLMVSEVTLNQDGMAVSLTWRVASDNGAELLRVRRDCDGEPGSTVLATMSPVSGQEQAFQDDSVTPGRTYTYWLEAELPDGWQVVGGPWTIAVKGPAQPLLLSSSPNPLKDETTIRFYAPRREQTEVEVYASDGRLVWRAMPATCEAGVNAVVWAGRDQSNRPVASGEYFYTVRVGAAKIGGSLIVLR